MILIGTDDGIYRWFEGCGWPIFHSLQGRTIVSLTSPGAGVIAAITGDGQILESVNNGQDWRVLPRHEADAPVLLAVWGEPETIVMATRPLGLYRRPFGAPLPEFLPRPPGPVAADALVRRGLADRVGDGVRTLARGATALLGTPRRPVPARARPEDIWTTLGKPDVAKGKMTWSAIVRALAIREGSSPAWFAAVRGGGLWRSRDEGRTWEQCPGLPDEILAVRTVTARPGLVVAATTMGCRFSSDDGQTWEDRSTGLEPVRHLTAIEVKPDNPEILLTGTAASNGDQFALFESTNGGKAWTQVKRGFPEASRGDVIADIRYDPAALENVVVALGSGELWLSRFDRAYWCPLARQIGAARVLCAVD
jgi:hypothetical protein